jgi:hypothetical protein
MERRMHFDLEAAGLDPEKLVTRGQLADLVRDRFGIPLTKSRIEKDAALGHGPKVAAVYGRTHLITLRDGFAYALAKARPVEA